LQYHVLTFTATTHWGEVSLYVRHVCGWKLQRTVWVSAV